MPTIPTTPPRKYIAEVIHSQEITLFGTADLGFWTRMLQPQNLVPIARNGQAEFLAKRGYERRPHFHPRRSDYRLVGS